MFIRFREGSNHQEGGYYSVCARGTVLGESFNPNEIVTLSRDSPMSNRCSYCVFDHRLICASWAGVKNGAG